MALPSLLDGCDPATDHDPITQGAARLQSRPGTPTGTIAPGTFSLGLSTGRDGLLFVPTGYSPAQPLPLLLALHGAQGSATSQIALWSPYAEVKKWFVLAVESRATTWDGVLQQFGPDVAFIDSALHYAFDRCSVVPSRVYLAGVSDGATYTISLALANGDLFPRAVAFFPAAIRESNSGRHGKSEFFIAHGRQDNVIPVSRSRNDIVPALRQDGYTVEYLEYDGGHQVIPSVSDAAAEWLNRS
jgi:phospholipase/carboxylesterase